MTTGEPGELKLHMMESTYRSLNRLRIQNVMLLCSLYDYYTVEEDGMLEDILHGASFADETGGAPSFHQVPDAQTALQMLRNPAGVRFDMIICMSTGDGSTFREFTERVKEINETLPVTVLTHNSEELRKVSSRNPGSVPYRLFTWMGNGEIIGGIIQLAENTMNAPADCGEQGAPCLLLVEDDVTFYSRYLHQGMEVIHRSCRDSLSSMKSSTRQKLKARARTKVLLATNMEEALENLESYSSSLVGVITDMRFHRNGSHDNKAGLALIEKVREKAPGVPVVLQTSEANGAGIAAEHSVGYVNKNSETLIADLGQVLRNYMDFDELRFLDADGNTARTASNVAELATALENLPEEFISECWLSGRMRRWLRIRTELDLCKFLEKAASVGLEGRSLLKGYRAWKTEQRRGYVTPYSRSFHEEKLMFSRLGSGSMGGKGRGLAFIDRMLAANLEEDRFRRVELSVPNTVIITTEFFDEFIRGNDLHSLAIECQDDDRINRAFQKASLPATILGDLRDYLRTVTTPIAVRSSSLLEDAMYQPFAGIYATKMLPNNSRDLDVRFRHLVSAVKFVYASAFMKSAKSYIRATNHRVEEEKMAVLLQKVEGRQHRDLFYPHFSGVGRSYDFYPAGSAKPEDGVVNVALGLGKAIVDGGMSLRFTPRYPRVLPQFGTLKDMLDNSQKRFYAVEMNNSNWGSAMDEDQYITSHGLEQAEKDGTLEYLGSTYDAANERVMDGITRPGPRVLNFAHILKSGIFPLPQITDYLLKMGEKAMGCPVEIEFAVTLGEKRPMPARFGLLQIRPMVVSHDLVDVDPDSFAREELLCITQTALGNGTIQSIQDVVYVKPDDFSAARTRDIVKEVEALNRKLFEAERPFILIGPGRWGSSDPWLGIPVTWSQISGARVIVEASQPNMNIDPSQGSHFFQNMTSLGVVYFTVPHNRSGSMINWERLNSAEAVEETPHLRHIRLGSSVKVMVDGRTGTGAMILQ
ncbi:MAG TPA: PEP/pyruvate-binding domain-containing protein [Candidatus Sabulitectum sp.]|nr:PEP/pyruvate-binding domain-containing protein [Candidatus Sabulitectum sp.]HPF31827.1 PEP/pyruvate-binding domain-containing protein [Candidatus Sabulitectum sp.]HPJ27904.1 PEP/pyruvate-binding domain-containing protein [Candidatus Sabulitectum sp.]HPR21867.1 PEP/pyruvate-binding domain-containing protein [Candidatus Sabulitectum sp.]